MNAACKTCTRCGVLMHLSYFGVRKRDGKLKPYSACRACMRERWKEWNRGVRQPVAEADRSYVPPTDFLWPGPVEPVALVWRAA